MTTKQYQRAEFYLEVAKLIAKRSYSKRNKVGAVIYNDQGIISEGYNGTPPRI